MSKINNLTLLSIVLIQFSFSACSENSDNKVVETIVHNGIHYGSVISPYTDRVWLDRNLGASELCKTIDDAKCYGDYYQWGRSSDGHEKNTSQTTTLLATDLENAGSDFIYTTSVPYTWTELDSSAELRSRKWSSIDGNSTCPLDYRVPTIEEITAETLDVNVSNAQEMFNSFLKFPSAGFRSEFTGLFEYVGEDGLLWSVTNNTYNASSIEFSQDIRVDGNNFAKGGSVRCIKN